MDTEEESTTWVEESTFPPKTSKKGQEVPKAGPQTVASSDPKDLRHAYTDSASTRSERLKARNQNKISFLAELRHSGQHGHNLWYRSRGVDELHPTFSRRGGVRLVTPPVEARKV